MMGGYKREKALEELEAGIRIQCRGLAECGNTLKRGEGGLYPLMCKLCMASLNRHLALAGLATIANIKPRYDKAIPKFAQRVQRYAPGKTTLIIGDRKHLVRLNEDKVRQIRKERARGEKIAAIAKRFDVSTSLVYHVLNGRMWSHVK